VFTLLNALLWLYYGLTKPDGLLIATVNGFGAAMEAIYVILFIVYAADQATRVGHPTNIGSGGCQCTQKKMTCYNQIFTTYAPSELESMHPLEQAR
jgi:hypothetical protein